MGGTVWVVGAGGLVGSAFVDALAARGQPAIALDRRALDVTKASAMKRLGEERPPLVVFAAARPWVEGCERDPEGTRPINVEAPLAFARALPVWGGRLAAFSTEYVFDGTLLRPYVEDDTPCPLNVYGAQKLELERGLAGSAHLVVRTSGVFGPERAKKSFPWQLTRASAEAPLRVPSDQLITPTWAPALAQATLAALEQGISGVLHVASTSPVPRVAFARALIEACGFAPDVIEAVPTNALGLSADRPRHAGLGTDRAAQAGLPLLSVDQAVNRFAQQLGR